MSCSGVTHGLFGSDSALRGWNQNAHAPGSLCSPSDAAPKCFFKTFRCYGRLIFRKSSSAFSPKRSTFSRCAASGGRGKLRSPLAPHRNAPSGHSGVSHGLFMISHHRPCGRWCFARLIRQAETLELQLHSQPPSKRTALSPLKRSCSRFAPLTLRCRTEPALRAAPVFRSAY